MASKYQATGTSLVVQWLSPSNAGDTDRARVVVSQDPTCLPRKKTKYKQKHYCNKFIRDFKISTSKKSFKKVGYQAKSPISYKKNVWHGLFKFSLSFIKYMLNIYNIYNWIYTIPWWLAQKKRSPWIKYKEGKREEGWR